MNNYLLKGTDILQVTTLYLHATGGDRTRACQGYNIETFNVFTGLVPANIFQKQEQLQLAEASFRDHWCDCEASIM